MLSRKAFTLIELMVAIVILSVMMLYLYKSYANINLSNNIVQKEVDTVSEMQQIKKVIFLDFSLALPKSVKIENREKNEDIVFLQSSHSIHKRYHPYITYIVKNKKLYRLESLKKIDKYDIDPNSEFEVDLIGEVDNFRVYKSSNTKKQEYLINIGFKDYDDLVLKINSLNSE